MQSKPPGGMPTFHIVHYIIASSILENCARGESVQSSAGNAVHLSSVFLGFWVIPDCVAVSLEDHRMSWWPEHV